MILQQERNVWGVQDNYYPKNKFATRIAYIKALTITWADRKSHKTTRSIKQNATYVTILEKY